MAIRSGRVGVRHDQVDHYGRIKNVADGIFSNVSAGSLVSSSSADNSKINTPSSFTGKIDLTSIKGNTIKWNQLAKPVYDNYSFERYGLTYSCGTTPEYTITGTSTFTEGDSNLYNVVAQIQFISGHKYLLYSSSKIFQLNGYGLVTTPAGKPSNIITAPSTGTESFSIKPVDNSLVASGTVINDFVSLGVFDLTTMFGTGNEPTTAEQFKSMFPLDYYQYDTGSLLSFKAKALQNTFTGEEIHLPTLTYFPNGMDGVGSDYDELTNIKAYKRMSRVDLGSINWNYDATYTMFVATISDMSISASKNGICEMYTVTSAWVSSDEWTNGNMLLTLGGADNLVRIKNTSYTDATAFKAAMSGVYLVYPLATPIETDVDVDFNLSINVNEGENLQLLPTGTDTPASAPLRASVTSYKSGATGNDVEKLLGSIAQVETSPATGNHSVGDYIMYNYQLYKVTASITTGASLVVGTNITATTVMDEFLTL